MKYTIRFSGQFKKSYKLCKRRGYDMTKLQTVMRILGEQGFLPAEYRPHVLSGNWAGICTAPRGLRALGSLKEGMPTYQTKKFPASAGIFLRFFTFFYARINKNPIFAP